ncbi:hypothetical protein I5U65_00480 [Stenotrophomonas maltophilia]|nr:hypothetical protein [Stenotrophomonas maltophilia]
MTVSHKVDQFVRDSDIANQIVHGGRDTVVQTDGGPVPSFSRAIGSITKIDERLTVLEDGQSSGRIIKATWADLKSIPTTPSGSRGASVIGDSGTHNDPVTGQSVANNGDYIEAPTGWKWVRAESLASKASRAELDSAVSSITRTTSNRPELSSLQRWVDGAGFVAGELTSDGLKTPGFSVGKKGMAADGIVTLYGTGDGHIVYRDRFGFWLQVIGLGDQTVTGDGYRNRAGTQRGMAANDYLVRDRFGFWLMSMKDTALRAAAASSGSGSSISDRDRLLLAGNAEALATSMAARTQIPADVQRPVFDYNIVIVYGQSLASGYEGWPAKSTTNQEANLLMLGDSTRPNARHGSSFVPVGDAVLKPMRAVVQSTASGNPVMTPTEIAALVPGNNNDGESVEHGAINFWRRLYLDDRWLSADPSRKVVAINCAMGGQTIARLSKGHASGYFRRILDGVQCIKAIAEAEGKTCGIVAVLHLQGEFDYTAESEGVNDYAVFFTKTAQLFEDICTDAATGICSQPKRPAFFTYQTGAQYARDNNELAIGRAQIDLAQRNGVFLAAPNAPYTDKGGHLDANGYRWLGMQFGKVMHKVLTKGEGWQPMRPIKAQITGREALVFFLVPTPPLRFASSYRGSAGAYDSVSKGFRVTDAAGEVAVVAASIAGSATVALQLARDTVGMVKVWYSPSTVHQGHGNVCDSDSTVAPYMYEYSEGSGDYHSANIADLVGKPYPLNNYSVATVLDAAVIK